MNYSDNPGNVMCDVFKPGGKWYERITLNMSGYYAETITPFDAVVLALKDANHYKLGDWNFYVPDPYHHNAYPVMVPAHGEAAAQWVPDALRCREYMRKEKENRK